MHLHPNWRAILRRAWSLRLNALSIALSAAEVIVGVFTDDPPLPRGAFAALAGAIAVSAAVARLVAQQNLSGDDA